MIAEDHLGEVLTVDDEDLLVQEFEGHEQLLLIGLHDQRLLRIDSDRPAWSFVQRRGMNEELRR